MEHLPGSGRRDLRQPVEVGLIRSLPVKARMRPAGIVEAEVTADRGTRLGDRVVCLQINFFVFDRSPQALDEDIVAPGALAVHADGDTGFEKNAGEAGAGELTALIRVEDFRAAVTGQGFIQRLDAEPRFL